LDVAEYEEDIRIAIPFLVQLLQDPTSPAEVVADSEPGELSEMGEFTRIPQKNRNNTQIQ
jgi:hypothetical protein